MNTTRNKNAVTSLLYRAQVQDCVVDASPIQSFHLDICIILGSDRINCVNWDEMDQNRKNGKFLIIVT